jgi:hypothetical protein
MHPGGASVRQKLSAAKKAQGDIVAVVDGAGAKRVKYKYGAGVHR